MAIYKNNLPNLQLIADEAGVSKTTVSYVLNKKKGISPQTIKLVEDTIKKHNYYEIYRCRAKKHNNVIGLIVPDIADPYFYKIIEAIKFKINEYNILLNTDFEVILCVSNNKHSEEVKFAKLLKKLNITGLIIAPSYHNQNYLINIFGDNFPIVFFDRTLEIFNETATVIKTSNNYEITKEGINYLIELGHRRIGFVYGFSNIETASQREKAYEDALKENKIIFDKSLVKEIDTYKRVGSDEHIKECYEEIKELIETKKVTALFCAQNFASLSAIKYIVDKNKKIPDDISIICFDNNEWIEAFNISAIRQPIEGIAKLTSQALIKKIFPFLSIEEDDTLNLALSAVFIKRKSITFIEHPLLINSDDGYVRDEKGNVYGVWDKKRKCVLK